jgi:hypothetical protein
MRAGPASDRTGPRRMTGGLPGSRAAMTTRHADTTGPDPDPETDGGTGPDRSELREEARRQAERATDPDGDIASGGGEHPA